MSLADHFEEFARWCEGTAPLYERLARGVADDPALLDVAAAAPEGRSPPHLLLAAVHYLLLRGAEHPLAGYYATCVDDPRDPDDDLRPTFREFCLEREETLREIVTSRRTQTNAVRRCAVLYPSFAYVARRVDAPLALIEVGPSAGLNLLWDRYAYECGDRRRGDPDSPVVIASTVREGAPPLPDRPPAVASRAGIDLAPLDVRDPDDVAWLRALVWPEHGERHALLEDAIAVAREEPPDLIADDALERLPEVVAGVPDGRPVCVFNTQTLYQLDDADRERFRSLVADLGAGRELHWLSGEGAVDRDESALAMTHAVVEDGALAAERIAVYEQHGAWIEWVAGE